MTTFNINEDFPIKYDLDILVVGGGTGGIFAAIVAGMEGKSVLLLEKSSMLGGTMTTCGVDFPGLFHAWNKQIIDGPCWQSILRAHAFDKSTLPDFTKEAKHHWQHQIKLNIFSYITVLEEMCKENKVDILFHSQIAYAKEDKDYIYLLATGKEGLFALRTKYLIDASGDANIIGLLGYERIREKEVQPATLINNIDGYNLNEIDRNLIDKKYEEALGQGLLKKSDTQGRPLYDLLKERRIALHIPDIFAADSREKSQLEKESRRLLKKILIFLKTIPGLENTYISYFATECGVRETYRIVGERLLCKENYLSGYMYPDAISYAFYPIDLHVPGGIKQVFLEKDIIPTIAYSALIPKESKRVLACGRCISSDRETNSAIRVQAPCMSTGQAAGMAATIALENNSSVKDIDFLALKERLRNINHIVPTSRLQS